MTKPRGTNPSARWHVSCSEPYFEQCRRDPKFAHLVALARALNALRSSHSLLSLHSTGERPAEVRRLMNSYFFSSAILYEAIGLIRKMNRVFKDDSVFEGGLKSLLKDPIAQKIEKMHLNPARNHAVFHFLPGEFDLAIQKQPAQPCVFMETKGKKRRDVHFSYADIVAGEMMIGVPAHQEQFFETLKSAAKETSVLVGKFEGESEKLIYTYLHLWGFRRS